MKNFMDSDFLLENETAKVLFHDHADKMPILDYHCHLDARDIYDNKRFNDMAEVWLGGDHYKWRIMRACGVAEKYITGDAEAREKFWEFAGVVSRAIGNPIYHWVHLELQRFFDCNTPLTPDTARDIWDFCNDRLRSDETMRVRGIIKKARVEVIVTTDDPTDSLEWHKRLADDETFKTKVLPGWRLGTVLEIESPDFPGYIKELTGSSGVPISDYSCLKTALLKRMEYFDSLGCRTGDHGLTQVTHAPASEKQVNDIFCKRLRNDTLTDLEINQFKYGLLQFCAKEYAGNGWVMELHMGVLRNVNSRMLKQLGPNTGYDSSDSTSGLSGLARFLDELDNADALPRTLLFPVDPADNLTISTLAGCFHQEGIRSKVQQGSAWWFNDTLSGMEQQIITFAEQSVLANFAGMLTDSRSFLSYTRHEYFRRILCNILGGWAESGRYIADMKYLGKIVRDICYNNAKEYFGF